MPRAVANNHSKELRVRHDKVDRHGAVTIRYKSKLHHIGMGRANNCQRLILLVAGRDIRVLSEDGGRLRLEKISEKIHRKPEKGGLPNVLFVQAPIEEHPPELNQVADEIQIYFPWGSLLRSVAIGDKEVLGGLHRIAVPEAWLEVLRGSTRAETRPRRRGWSCRH